MQRHPSHWPRFEFSQCKNGVRILRRARETNRYANDHSACHRKKYSGISMYNRLTHKLWSAIYACTFYHLHRGKRRFPTCDWICFQCIRIRFINRKFLMSKKEIKRVECRLLDYLQNLFICFQMKSQ